MVPSLPCELPEGTQIIQSVFPLECAMLRFDLPCCNDAWTVLVCPQKGQYDTEEHRLIPVCMMCVDDSGGGEWAAAVARKVHGL